MTVQAISYKTCCSEAATVTERVFKPHHDTSSEIPKSHEAEADPWDKSKLHMENSAKYMNSYRKNACKQKPLVDDHNPIRFIIKISWTAWCLMQIRLT